MTGEAYRAYLNKVEKNFEKLVTDTQDKLDKSKSKGEDMYILNKFWTKLADKAIKKWDMEVFFGLFEDHFSNFPMPESVSKQFVNMLFDIEHVDVLFDLDINEGLDIEFTGTKKETIKYYDELFKEEDE